MTSTRPATRHTWQRAAIRDLLEGGEAFRTAQARETAAEAPTHPDPAPAPAEKAPDLAGT